MPYMERLTWDGIALHAGNLPGYPASHGCMRLPLNFARKLYGVTRNGTTVIITDQKSEPGTIISFGLIFAASASDVSSTNTVSWDPSKALTGSVSILVSSADSVVYVYRKGEEIGRAPVSGLEDLNGWYVYSALEGVDAQGRRDWLSLASGGGHAPNIKDLLRQVKVDQNFIANVRAVITPGSTLILTDAPVSISTRSNTGFNILTTSATP